MDEDPDPETLLVAELRLVLHAEGPVPLGAHRSNDLLLEVIVKGGRVAHRVTEDDIEADGGKIGVSAHESVAAAAQQRQQIHVLGNLASLIVKV